MYTKKISQQKPQSYLHNQEKMRNYFITPNKEQAKKAVGDGFPNFQAKLEVLGDEAKRLIHKVLGTRKTWYAAQKPEKPKQQVTTTQTGLEQQKQPTSDKSVF